MKKISKKGHPSRYGKRYLALFMSLCLIGTMAPVSVKASLTGFTMTGQPANAAVKTINLNAAVLRPTADNDGKWDAVNGNKVYFGNYNGSATAYRVLSSPSTQTVSNCLLLDCDTTLMRKQFDENDIANEGQTKENAWPNSDLERWLKDSEFYGGTSVFSTFEKNAIAETILSGQSTYTAEYIGCSCIDYPASDHVFFLSVAEAEGLYKDEGAREKLGVGVTSWWWLRSANANYDSEAGCVNTSGYIEIIDICNYYGVSPALNVNLSSILFASESGMSKTSALTAVSDSTAKTWKLTLLDSSKGVSVTNGQSVTRTDNSGSATITVPYTYTDGNPTNAVTQISVMITDKAYTESGAQVLYYGKLADAATTSGGISGGTSGTGTFDLPSEYADKSCGTDYYAYLIAEEVNGNTETDYASMPVQINIPAVLHTVNVTNGTLSDGSTTGEYAAGDTVTITADTAPTGERFKEWSVESGTVTFADSASETTTFVMPGEAVSVKAVYEVIPVTEYTITATAGANGSISPAGAVRVAAGDSRTFTFGADSGYVIDSLKVDGAAVTANGNSYTFNNVNSGHTIEVTFKQEAGSAAVVYQILNGADGTWTAGDREGFSIRGDGAFSKFTGVKVDGNMLDRSNYTAKEGSTIITLKADYLNTLSVGRHTIEILWTDGSAGTAFTINAKVSGDVTGTTNNNSTANNNSTSNDNGTVSGENTGNAVAPKTGDITLGVRLPVRMLGIGLVLILAGWKEKKNLNILRK